MQIPARRLLNFDTNELVDILNGEFELVFDNNEVVKTNSKQTIFSHLAWNIFREYPEMDILPKHHHQSISGGAYTGKSHRVLLGNICWDVINRYYRKKGFDVSHVALRINQLSGDMYNFLICHTSEYVMSIDLEDYIDIMTDDEVSGILATACPDADVIDSGNKAITKILKNKTRFVDNQLARILRMDVVSTSQTLQMIGMGKAITDIDSYIYPTPIDQNYVDGFHKIYNSAIDTRSTAKSLWLAAEPLEDAEYFARRLGQLVSVIERVVPGDCGSEGYIRWRVRPPVFSGDKLERKSDLEHIEGKYYYDPDSDELKVVRVTDTHLHNQSILLRTVIKCRLPDTHTFCSTCMGELAKSVPENTNIGTVAAGQVCAKSTQSVMSTKHDDAGAALKLFTLNEVAAIYLSLGADGSSYNLKPRTPHIKSMYLLIDCEEFAGITDITQVENIEELSEHRISDITDIAIMIVQDGKEYTTPIAVNVDNRNACVTYDLMRHIRDVGWETTEEGAYKIDITSFPSNQLFLNLSRKHYNMSAHSELIASTIESSTKDMKKRSKITSVDAELIDFSDLVASKIEVNFAWLEIIVKATTCNDILTDDYRIPPYPHDRTLGIASRAMAARSLAVAMAFEGQHEVLYDPRSFFGNKRESSSFESFLVPEQYFKYHGMK